MQTYPFCVAEFYWNQQLILMVMISAVRAMRSFSYNTSRGLNCVRVRFTAELTEINQKIIILPDENKKLIRRAAMACSAAITTRFRAESGRHECIGATYPTKIPTVLIFQWTVFSDGRSWVQVHREAERKQNAEFSRSLVAARLALGCSLIREPLHDVCRIIVD